MPSTNSPRVIHLENNPYRKTSPRKSGPHSRAFFALGWAEGPIRARSLRLDGQRAPFARALCAWMGRSAYTRRDPGGALNEVQDLHGEVVHARAKLPHAM